MRRSLPLWNEAIQGRPDWDAIFDGYAATTDYPGCCFWRELLGHYPQAKVILTVRDAEGWFESVMRRFLLLRDENRFWVLPGKP
ncbi:sulfotransferase [Acidovorax sp. NCPPB 3576]|uniref:sulfotransferase n=1 Tax=Acidovorax sp. NCPPB 3576 TaxID=2940488 RepID=UPI00234BF760|nr:sulfotransferase [Acidovorax sp. NCPPB 3576]